MVQLYIVKTAKGYSAKDKFSMIDSQTRNFSNIADAKSWVREEYGKAKRSPMYVDTKEGKAKRVGYIIGFRNSDLSHYPVQKWIQQDWIEFREVIAISP